MVWKKCDPFLLGRKYKSWREFYQVKQKFCTIDHHPFYRMAGKYLPNDKNGIILDIGSGEGDFVVHLNLTKKYKNIFLLDKNPLTIERLKNRFKNGINTILYKAPEKIPLKAASVNYIHCSHIMEHLYHHEFYQLLKEMDRVLATNGILVISTPLLWDGFYGDISHIKPYNPWVFYKYLCVEPHNFSQEDISQKYVILDLEFRYFSYEFDDSWGSEYRFFDLILYFFKKILSKLKIKKYEKNGFTMVLKKL
ncbi:MAG: class I SAM-dependent methyltransferase [Promethearchaeota archaeon]